MLTANRSLRSLWAMGADDYADLIEAATDHELYLIEQVAERAGVIWVHRTREDRVCWINRRDDGRCGGCGTPRSDIMSKE